MIDHLQLNDTLTGLIIFEISDEEFCADIKDVSAIINPGEAEPKINLEEGKPIEINGLCIPLIDLHKFLGVHKKKHGKDPRIILIEINNKMFGFIAEKVKEIFTMSKSFKSKLKFIPNNGKYLEGLLKYEDRNLYIPDFNKIILESRI